MTAITAYERVKSDRNALDFDDLLARTFAMQRTNQAVRAAVARSCDHVLVDEFQDTNSLQLDLVLQWAERCRAVTACGDLDQTIYSWRFADPSNYHKLKHAYPGLEVVHLEQSYRSTPSILHCALSVIAKSPSREPKRLFTVVPDGARAPRRARAAPLARSLPRATPRARRRPARRSGQRGVAAGSRAAAGGCGDSSCDSRPPPLRPRRLRRTRRRS